MLQTSQGRSQLQAMFNTCNAIVSDFDVATFMESLSGGVAEVVQYNNDNRAAAMNINQMCSILMTGSSSTEMLAAYVKFNTQFNQYYGGGCTDSSYNATIQQMRNTDPNSDVAAARSWTWQTCIEYGYFQTGDSSKQPFSSTITLDWYLAQCRDIFGPQYVNPNIQWIITDYGSDSIRASNIVFPNGSIDPWHKLGVLEAPVHSEPTVLINGTAHCADLYAPTSTDLPGLVQARILEVEQIKKWLSGDQC